MTEGAGVVLACSACQRSWRPDLSVPVDTVSTGCPACGGWTWLAELATPATDVDLARRTR